MERKSFGRLINDVIINALQAEKSGRAAAEKTGLSNTAIENIKKGTSIKLDTLDQIIKGYPGLYKKLMTALIEEYDEKHTAATNMNEAAVIDINDEDPKVTIARLSRSIETLTQSNLVNSQTISQLLSREVVKQG